MERAYLKELEEMTSTREPLMLFHGGIMKVVPVFCVRLASLADRPERAVVTSTISYNSNLHRCHGVSGQVVQPKHNKESLDKLFSQEQAGSKKTKMGWSTSVTHLIPDHRKNPPNGAKIASCLACRETRAQFLLFGGSDLDSMVSACPKCTDWNLLGSSSSEGGSGEGASINFPPMSGCPTHCTPGSPTPPPQGRDIFETGTRLPFIRITFDLLKKACKFAFCQASRPGGRGSHWGKGQTVSYLKLCGVGPRAADDLFDSARKCAEEEQQGEVDYFQDDKIHTFVSPPSWCQGGLEVDDFIETVMHQLGLGIAKYNHELCCMFLADCTEKSGLSKAEFLRTIQPLLQDLKVFLLSWLQAYPFNSGSNPGSTHTTGGWVGENWMCYTRLSKLFFAWLCRCDVVSSAPGVDDLRRMVNSYHAFVSRCMTHSGIDEDFIRETECYMKEFLSSVKEFDIRVRHGRSKKPPAKSSQGKKKKGDSANKKRKTTEAASTNAETTSKDVETTSSKDREDWHLKANYMSLPNLIQMMRLLGPLVLWWDGGGKGEKYIQSVKPHIKHGVRGDASNFFKLLLEKLCRVVELKRLEFRYGSLGDTDQPDESVADVLNELVTSTLNALEIEENVAQEDHNNEEGVRRKVTFNELEEHGMTKDRTIYVYKKEERARNSIHDNSALCKPLAGIVVEKGENEFQFQIVYRKAGKMFGCRPLLFDDKNGEDICGMWSASVSFDDETEHTYREFSDIQAVAKMAAVAIPLKYVMGIGRSCSNKYHVITNWWKERNKDNQYQFPSLDPRLYGNLVDPRDSDLLRQASKRAPSSSGRRRRKDPESAII